MIHQNENKTFKEKFGILITLFIKLEIKEAKNWTANDWGRERKAASILLKKYPDFDFFYFLPDLCDKCSSLWGMETKYWKEQLNKRYKDWEEKKKNEFKLEEKPVVQLEFINKKPKNMFEFLNN